MGFRSIHKDKGRPVGQILRAVYARNEVDGYLDAGAIRGPGCSGTAVRSLPLWDAVPPLGFPLVKWGDLTVKDLARPGDRRERGEFPT